MSACGGEVISKGKVVGHFEYNGTADICYPAIYKTPEELQENWRKPQAAKCTCEKPKKPDPIILWSDYGGGFFWAAEACLRCGAILTGLDPYPESGLGPVGGYPL